MAPRPDWLHCNICQAESAAAFFMTSCGKVCCGSCRKHLSKVCDKCKIGRCRLVELNHKAPKEVLKLFSDVEALIKDVYKIFAFQQAQERMQLDHKRRNVARLKAEADAIEERDKADRERLHQLKQTDYELDQRIASVEAEIQEYKDLAGNDSSSEINDVTQDSLFSNPGARKKKSRRVEELFQKLGSSTPEDWHSPGAGSSSQLNYTRRSEGDETFKEEKFLEMKTPAAWHKSRPGHMRPQPNKRSSLTSDGSGRGYFDTTTASWIKKPKTEDFQQNPTNFFSP